MKHCSTGTVRAEKFYIKTFFLIVSSTRWSIFGGGGVGGGQRQEPAQSHHITSHKTSVFTNTTVSTTNLARLFIFLFSKYDLHFKEKL
jgi:hypothetical protein